MTGVISSEKYVSIIFFCLSKFYKNDMRITELNSTELQQAIFDRFEIMEEDGRSFNQLIPHTSDSMSQVLHF
jgi:hypothetical protein